MTTFKEYITQNNILNISYAVRISGLPYIWTDGKAAWNSTSTFTEKIGGLISRDFNITQKSDPLKPLDTGNGLTISLADDGSDYLHLLFAPAYEGVSTRLTASVDADAASLTFNVISSTGISAADYVYCGRETSSVDSTTATSIILDSRGVFNSLRSAHELRDLDQGTLGPKVTTSPVIFKNRTLEVVARPVDALSGETDSSSEWVIWAGLVEEVSNETTHVEIRCEALTKLIDSNWPHSMPSCTLRGIAAQMYMVPTDWVLTWNRSDNVGAFDTGSGQMGTYDTSSTFTPFTNSVTGHYTVSHLLKILNDTIIALVFGGSTDGNQFSITAEETPTKTRIIYSWGATSLAATMKLTLEGPFITKLFGGARDVTLEKGARKKLLFAISNTGATITKDADKIQVFMDVPDRPFFVHTNLLAITGTDKGYAKISNGEKFEIIGFSTVTAVDEDIGHYELSGVERGLGGTKAKKWVSKIDPDDTEEETEGAENIRIVQVPLLTRYPASAQLGITLSDCILACLLSTDDPDSSQNSFEVFGYGMGLGYNERNVDTEGIRAILDRSDLPKITYFWIDVGKGKETLEEMLKFAGCFLVTKRFIRNGTAYYGISIETIDPAYSTIYSSSVDDTFRKQGTKVSLNYNERLVINNVTMKPFISIGKESSPVTHNAQDSITDYGASESLELKPSAVFQWVNSDGYSLPDYDMSEIVTVHMQVVQLSGYRWLGAFANGTYVVKVQTTYRGLGIQVGDRVLIDLTNVRAPNGSLGIVGIPGKCIRAVHRHEGNNKGADLEFRATFESVSELAPCAIISGQSGTTLTLSANAFTDDFDAPPFAEEAYPYAVDADWFDPEAHGDNLEVFIYVEGEAATNTTKTISARSGNTITVNSALSAGLITALGASKRLIMTFANWSGSLSALQKNYAYIASNTAPPLLGGADQPKEFS